MCYELRSYDLDNGKSMVVLAPVGSKSFIEKLIESPKKATRLSRITKIAERIESNGVEWALISKKLKIIDNDLALYELRVGDTTIRLMTYFHEREIVVYLFDFDGHQGKTSSIPESYISRGKELAVEARKCMETERAQS